MAPRGTAVIATDDGFVKKLFTSVPGGLTVYEFDPDQRFCYYYAHLDRYASGLHEGQRLHRGEILGYVGTTGNAPKNTPHLHFALIRLDADRRWWRGCRRSLPAPGRAPDPGSQPSQVDPRGVVLHPHGSAFVRCGENLVEPFLISSCRGCPGAGG